MTAFRGSCLCGGVKFEITGPLLSPLNCHCSLCRKQNAAPFRSRARAQVKDFRWRQGENLVKYYETRAAIYAASAVSAVPPSSIARHQTRNAPQNLRTPCLNTVFRSPFSTILRCGQHVTSSSAARRSGSRSPMNCHNTRNTRRQLDRRPWHIATESFVGACPELAHRSISQCVSTAFGFRALLNTSPGRRETPTVNNARPA